MHPFTARHLGVLQELLKFQVISPISKTLACGDTGKCVDWLYHHDVHMLISLCHRRGSYGRTFSDCSQSQRVHPKRENRRIRYTKLRKDR